MANHWRAELDPLQPLANIPFLVSALFAIEILSLYPNFSWCNLRGSLLPTGYDETSCFEYPGPKAFPGSPSNSNFTFTNVSDKLGLRHQHRKNKPVRPYCAFPIIIPIANSNKTIRMEGEFCTAEQITGAVAAGDYDDDGYVDLFFTVADGLSRLYRNNGKTIPSVLITEFNCCYCESPIVVEITSKVSMNKLVASAM